MSEYIDVPTIGPVKRVIICTDRVKVVKDDEGRVLITDDGSEWHEVDMHYPNLKRLLLSKSKMAVGRRKIKEKSLCVLRSV